jgi:hypothetical protein
MTPHIAYATFDDAALAEDAQQYLLANEFEEENLEIKPASAEQHQRVTLNIYTKTSMEAQEAVDVLRNYGATGINMYEVV